MNGQSCAHVFCRLCLQRWSSRFITRASCPLCRQLLGEAVPDASTLSRLAAQSERCTCGTLVALSCAASHATECPHARASAQTLAQAGAPNSACTGRGVRVVFECPICPPGSGSRDAPGLAEHVEEAHRSAHRAAVCPVCVAMPWGDPSYVSRDIVAHILLRHRYEVQNVVPLEESEEAILQRVLEASAREAGVPMEEAEEAAEEAVPMAEEDV